MVSCITKLTILDVFLHMFAGNMDSPNYYEWGREETANITIVQSRKHACTLQLTTNSPRSFSGPTCDCNASLVQCQDTVQRPVKIHNHLKIKAHLEASLLTSKWLGIETIREVEVPAVEKLTPAKWTQRCYLKQRCRRDYAAASITQGANTAAGAAKGKGTLTPLSYWGELAGAHGNPVGKDQPLTAFKKWEIWSKDVEETGA